MMGFSSAVSVASGLVGRALNRTFRADFFVTERTEL
jgi:hypothetical protein